MKNDEMVAHVQAQLRLAAQHQSEGRKAQTIAVLRQMLSLEAAGTFWGNVAHMLYQAADLDGAEAAARNFVTSCPAIPQAKSLLANILGDTGKVEEAVELARIVAQELSDLPAAHYALAENLARMNRMHEAIASFEKTLELDPAHVLALEYIAYIDKARDPQPDLERVQAMLASGKHAAATDAAALHYARATLLERQQDWGEAFEAYSDGARIMRNIETDNLAAMERYVGRLKKSFNAQFFADRSECGCDNERTIFIVGMPRSGTTLVETILASHSKVMAGGETSQLGTVTAGFGSFEPSDLARVDEQVARGQDLWAAMGRAYAQLQNLRFGSTGRVTEKNLGHHLMLGAIAMIARGAPIIYCQRDPVATAWSCFKTRFLRGNSWSYDFSSIARYQRLYADLMRHWLTVLPKATILEVDYESLVADPDSMIAKILAHAKLEFEETCLSPHESKVPIATASLAQVRQPIYTDSVSGWKQYETWLEPYLNDLRAD